MHVKHAFRSIFLYSVIPALFKSFRYLFLFHVCIMCVFNINDTCTIFFLFSGCQCGIFVISCVGESSRKIYTVCKRKGQGRSLVQALSGKGGTTLTKRYDLLDIHFHNMLLFACFIFYF